MHTLSECYFSELLYLCTIQSNAVIQFNSSNNYEFDTILACLGPDSGDGNGIIRFLAIQTPEEKRVCDVLLHFPQHILVHHVETLGGFHHETDATSIFLLFLAPWISITHFLYPFKHTKRNPHFTFLITAFAILEIMLFASVCFLVQFSNM